MTAAGVVRTVVMVDAMPAAAREAYERGAAVWWDAECGAWRWVEPCAGCAYVCDGCDGKAECQAAAEALAPGEPGPAPAQAPASVAAPRPRRPRLRCPRCGTRVIVRSEDDATCVACGWDADAPTREPTAAEREEAEGHVRVLADGTRLVTGRPREPRHGKLKL